MNAKFRKHFSTFETMSYVKDDEEVRNRESIIDCSHGINPFGYSKAIDEEKALISKSKIYKYPPFPYKNLKKVISDYWSDTVELKTDNIRITSGSIGVLDTVNKLFVEKGAKVLGYCPQFSQYVTYVRMYGGIYESIPLKEENNFKFNYMDMINKMNDEYCLIYIDNPNNPTGQIIPLSELETIIEVAENRNICVIVDEAYGDFMEKENSALSLINKYNNLFVAKSFSKGYGIPGLRAGFMACSKALLEYYDIVNDPYNNNVIGIQSAILSLRDKNFIPDSIKKIREEKKKFIDSLSILKVLETSLDVPIMALQHPDEEVDLYKAFIKSNVLTISNFMGVGKNTVRLRIPANVDVLIKAIKNFEEQI